MTDDRMNMKDEFVGVICIYEVIILVLSLLHCPLKMYFLNARVVLEFSLNFIL